MADKICSFKGIVVAKKANFFIVKIDSTDIYNNDIDYKYFHNSSHLICTSRKRLTHHGLFINVGDYVFLDSINWKTNRAVISGLEARKSLLKRPPVANVTDIIVALSVKKPEFNFDQASRFLLTAERSNLKVHLILTKIDLISHQTLSVQISRFQSWGYQPLGVSSINGQGISNILTQFKKIKLAVLCGPSGVGKSSLLQLLLPNESIAVGDLSGKLERGRNTTRHVQLYSFGDESLVADTPGFNRPDLDFDLANLQLLFPEIRSQLKQFSCRFRNCLHCDEPGCRINTNWERYEQYRKLIQDNI